MLRVDNTTVTSSARNAWRSSETSITFSTYSITSIKFCHSKESLIDVCDDFLLRLHGVSLSLASFWVLLLIDSLSITSFLCASLGPGAFSLAHCGSCLVDRGRKRSFTMAAGRGGATQTKPGRSDSIWVRVRRFHAREKQKVPMPAIVEGDLFLSARSSFFLLSTFFLPPRIVP